MKKTSIIGFMLISIVNTAMGEDNQSASESTFLKMRTESCRAQIKETVPGFISKHQLDKLDLALKTFFDSINPEDRAKLDVFNQVISTPHKNSLGDVEFSKKEMTQIFEKALAKTTLAKDWKGFNFIATPTGLTVTKSVPEIFPVKGTSSNVDVTLNGDFYKMQMSLEPRITITSMRTWEQDLVIAIPGSPVWSKSDVESRLPSWMGKVVGSFMSSKETFKYHSSIQEFLTPIDCRQTKVDMKKLLSPDVVASSPDEVKVNDGPREAKSTPAAEDAGYGPASNQGTLSK